MNLSSYECFAVDFVAGLTDKKSGKSNAARKP